MTAEERLQWYACCFDCVEVNAKYYALPSYRNSELWADRTPPGFEFAIKAYAHDGSPSQGGPAPARI